MSPALIECENQALQLTPTERAVLAEHLIASLDRLSDAQNEQLWFEEAERRYQAGLFVACGDRDLAEPFDRSQPAEYSGGRSERPALGTLIQEI